MPKRRRERDRPKAPPDAPYNPNKRILLCYASDEEIEASQDKDRDNNTDLEGHANVGRAATWAEYHIEEYPDDELSKPHGESFQNDAVSEAVDDDDDDLSEDQKWKSSAYKDHDTGQRAALGSLANSNGDDDGSTSGPEDVEALAYLRAVR